MTHIFDQSDEETKTKTKTDKDRQRQTKTENILKELPQRLVTFDTLITFLTIENNNPYIHRTVTLQLRVTRDSIYNSSNIFTASPNFARKIQSVLKRRMNSVQRKIGCQ